MASIVLYSDEYDRALDQGTLDPRAFDHYILCEGDSWMDRSSLAQLSLPWALSRSFRGRRGHRALFINLARFGDTLRGISETARDGLLSQWLDTQGLPFGFDAMLLSGGGNDFIDAALSTGADAILNDVGGMDRPTADDCYDADRVADLVVKKLDPAFGRLYDVVRGSRQSSLPMLLNMYSVPVPRHAPAYPGGKAWLARAYDAKGIPPSLWPEVTERLFIDVATTVKGWADGRTGVHLVPTDSVGLVPARAGSAGSSGDWLNEIHPNAPGWVKLARAWQRTLDTVL